MEIEVNGAVQEAAIRAVFDWVEGECDLNLEAFGPAARHAAAPASRARTGRSAVPSRAPRRRSRTGRTRRAPERARHGESRAPRAGSRRAGRRGARRRRLDPRQHREDRRAAELRRRARDHAVGAEPAGRAARGPRGRRAAQCARPARAPHARAAGKRHARAHAADQLRVQPLPAPGARPGPAPRQEDRAARSPATAPSSTRPCSRRSAIRWCTWCATPSTTASRCPTCALAAGKRGARHHRAAAPITRAATSSSKSATTAAACSASKILAKARERGLVGADEELSDERVLNLIFAPGFSTADVVSDVSGRGVGMDVVKRNINELGGHIQIHSTPGQGSTSASACRSRSPSSMASSRASASEVYVVPIVSIVETIQVTRGAVNSIASARPGVPPARRLSAHRAAARAVRHRAASTPTCSTAC